jgi:hypothetical protein
MLIVADEWGEVYFVADAGSGHDFPAPLQIADRMRS